MLVFLYNGVGIVNATPNFRKLKLAVVSGVINLTELELGESDRYNFFDTILLETLTLIL